MARGSGGRGSLACGRVGSGIEKKRVCGCAGRLNSQEATPTAIRLHRKLLTPVPEKKDNQQKGPLAPPAEPVEETLFVDASGRAGRSPDRALDKDIHFGETYEYRAQRVVRVRIDGQTLELDGPLSAPVHLEALDVFPPAVPVGLAAVAVAGENTNEPAIDLSWQPDTEADLAGYIVYRREGAGIGNASRPRWPWLVGVRDAHVQAGHSYIYAVSAIDEAAMRAPAPPRQWKRLPTPECNCGARRFADEVLPVFACESDSLRRR